jgi:hypothetical protein
MRLECPNPMPLLQDYLLAWATREREVSVPCLFLGLGLEQGQRGGCIIVWLVRY